MKKIFTSIAVIILWCSSATLYAYTIDVAKSYVAIQTLASSSKFIGANGTAPSVMSADITDVSQRLSFELVSTGIYRIMNGAGNYLTCNSSGTIAYAATLDATTDAQWTIADVAATGYVSFKSVSLSTSYLTSAAVLTGQAAFTGTPLTLTTTVPTAAGSSVFNLLETSLVFANGLVDPGFEKGKADAAPIGEWIDDKVKTLGGSGTSRVVTGASSSAGNQCFQLRYNTGSYFKISHKLNGLTAGSFYTFAFVYKEDGVSGALPVSNANVLVYATTTANDVTANAIGGPANYFQSIVPTVLFASQTPYNGSITFQAPASSCYITFAKLNTSPQYYFYIDEMSLELLVTPIITTVEKTLAFDGIDCEKTVSVTAANLNSDLTFTVPDGLTLSGTNLTGSGSTYTIAKANANATNLITITYDKTTAVSGNIVLSNGASASATVAVTATQSFIPVAGTKYYLSQTKNKSSKVVGLTGANQPALNSADVFLSQKFEFIPVDGVINYYYLRNDSSMYLNSIGSTSELIYEPSINLTNSQWMIGGTTVASLKFKNVATGAYLTSAAVTPGTVLTASGLSSDGNATYKLISSAELFVNNVIDGGFENVSSDGAPLGEWINDQSQTFGANGYSRVRAQYPTTGLNSFQLRFNAVTSNGADDGYYKVSHRLVNLTPGASYTFSFKYKVDDGSAGVPVANSQAKVYGATTPNVESADAIGGSNNYFQTEVPTVGITSQSSYTANVTFTAPGTSCYIVFAKLIAANSPVFFIYMDDMSLTLNPNIPTGNKDNFDNKKMCISVTNNCLRVFGVSNYVVCNVQGMKVAEVLSNKANIGTTLKSGIYIVKSGKEVQKVIVK